MRCSLNQVRAKNRSRQAALQHAVGDDGLTGFGAFLDNRKHQLLLAHATCVFNFKLVSLLEDFRHMQCLEFV